ncbi:hypothetical protein [Acinetobacter sp. RF14B]|uniref:hypothetical protein n=1 Tax=Acinetobacter sp. RF14B TaxID=2650965 RepID=UPI00116EDA54|nr:hypothetical protein [Acinetobacter sp. RF14B]TQR64457.1 hypothetical protein E2K52_07000 [Acinetobacter sp. RF14B]
MPQFKTLKLSNRRNNEAVMQCSAYGKLTVNLISKDDRQQNISFKAIIYQGDKVIHSSSFFSMKLELPRLNIGQYKLEIIPKRDETYFWYKNVPLKDFSYNFEISGDTTTVVDCLISRQESIIYNIKFYFYVQENNKLKQDTVWYEISYFQEVTDNINSIDSSSKKFSIDPELLKSIIYMESTHGYYDAVFEVIPSKIKENKSIRPTNINVEAWPMLFTREEANNVVTNIDTGAYMLKLISERVPDKDILKIASLYNSTNAKFVLQYGLEVKKFYERKPWNQIVENNKIRVNDKGDSKGEPYHGGD